VGCELTRRRYLWFALFAILLTAIPAVAAGDDEIRKAAADVSKSLEVQSKLPNDSGATEFPTERRSRQSLGFGGEGIYLPGGEVIFGLVQWAVIVVAVIAILAVLAILIREPLESRFHPTIGPPVPLEGAPPPPADPRELLARADQLAAQGLFAEAMHCVLLAAMILLGGPAADKTTDSRTSWELLRAATIPPTQMQALRDLVIRVERAWFGQRPAGAEDYRHVRSIFDAFRAPSAETA
jgi:hypothetical protein